MLLLSIVADPGIFIWHIYLNISTIFAYIYIYRIWRLCLKSNLFTFHVHHSLLYFSMILQQRKQLRFKSQSSADSFRSKLSNLGCKNVGNHRWYTEIQSILTLGCHPLYLNFYRTEMITVHSVWWGLHPGQYVEITVLFWYELMKYQHYLYM